MDQETRYQYQKRIRELERENARLRDYRDLAMSIYDSILEVMGEGKTLNQVWILKQYRRVMK